MAERRMFTKKITDGDVFTSMPPTTQCLYFHLCMSADDDGFSNNIRIAMFNAHASTDDFNTLVNKRFIIPFESGVIVIKHWKMHNYIQTDRYHKTKYLEEKSKLILKENGVYTECIQNGYNLDTEVRIDKDSIDKVSKDKDSKGKSKTAEAVVYYPNDEELNIAFKDFVDMRKKIKKPLTDRAIDLAIKKLNELSNNDNVLAIKIIEQSVMNSWQSFYPLKETTGTKQTSNSKNSLLEAIARA